MPDAAIPDSLVRFSPRRSSSPGTP